MCVKSSWVTHIVFVRKGVGMLKIQAEMARCWQRLVARLLLLCVCAAGLKTARPTGGIGFTYHPAACIPAITFCSTYTRRNNCVVRNCSNRVSGGSDHSDTNVPGRGRFVPKYTGRFSGWRGLRYGKCREVHSSHFHNISKDLYLITHVKFQGLLIN